MAVSKHEEAGLPFPSLESQLLHIDQHTTTSIHLFQTP